MVLNWSFIGHTGEEAWHILCSGFLAEFYKVVEIYLEGSLEMGGHSVITLGEYSAQLLVIHIYGL